MRISFVKYEGAGNDFIIIDDRESHLPLSSLHWVPQLCHRQKGIGADGVILLRETSSPLVSADFRMTVFNSDGSEAAMCGNGLRCLASFAHSLGLHPEAPDQGYRIETKRQILTAWVKESQVTATLGPYQWLEKEMVLEGVSLSVVDTGVPHAIVFLKSVSAEEFLTWAPRIRFHSFFQPAGVNVNFISPGAGGTFAIRTYERGVEGETLACGTGAAAAAIVAQQKYGLSSKIGIRPLSGEFLEFEVREDQVQMTGPARAVFEGHVSISR